MDGDAPHACAKELELRMRKSFSGAEYNILIYLNPACDLSFSGPNIPNRVGSVMRRPIRTGMAELMDRVGPRISGKLGKTALFSSQPPPN